MPRSLLKDPDVEASTRIFGNRIHPVCLSAVSKKTGIPRSTLSNWKRRPTAMPLSGFAKLVSSVGIPDEQVLSIIKSMK